VAEFPTPRQFRLHQFIAVYQAKTEQYTLLHKRITEKLYHFGTDPENRTPAGHVPPQTITKSFVRLERSHRKLTAGSDPGEEGDPRRVLESAVSSQAPEEVAAGSGSSRALGRSHDRQIAREKRFVPRPILSNTQVDEL
jgi:hypothetical protein